jgi:DNA processing protein
MKKLVLNNNFKAKLDRLSVKVGELNYLGADLESYENLPIVAIVGTRKPTPYGKMMTTTLAEELARAGVVIISGLALGIDALAHQSCLNVNGRTIAVVPRGSYPVTNSNIAKQIVTDGCTIISDESDPKIPIRVVFLQRNRIVAALSDAVIIPEAATKSGSLNTARLALEMNIPLFVVPGNTTSPMSAGTNQLLKEGARAITEAKDVFEILGLNNTNNQTALNLTGDNKTESTILQAMSNGISDQDSLQTETRLSIQDLQSAITMLEVQGRVAQDSLGSWHLK